VTLPLRVRLALVSAGLVVAIVAVLGGLVFLQMEGELRGSVDDGLIERASDLAADPPLGPDVPIAASDIGDVFAAVLGPDGEITAASSGFPTSVVTAAARSAGVNAHLWQQTIPSDEEPMAVRVYAAPIGDGRIVITGVAFDDQQATLDALLLDLALALPVAAALALLVGWYVGEAALRPVEQMRAEAAAISASEPARRLAVPGTRDELAALGESLNAMLDRLQAALERERRLVDDASHELRTPLANLKAELDLALRRARTQPELEAALRSAADESDRLARLAADLLVLARTSGGRLPVRLEEIDVGSIAREAAAAVDGRVATAGLVLTVSVAEGTRARVDAARLRQALDNLVDNAIRSAPRGGMVSIAGSVRDGELHIGVSDSGSGFRDGFLDDAFEPFSRSDEGRARTDGGAGLGLAIVRAIAESHGGSVRAENLPQGGALVELRLPMSPVEGRPSRGRPSAGDLLPCPGVEGVVDG
jgi:two-component system, OmpR family, sensor kinase